MAPPCYADVGKQARDLLSKGYHFGSWKFEARSTTATGLKFKTTAVNTTDNGKVLGGVELEYNWKDYGLKLVEKWNTENVLATEVSVEDQMVKGLKLAFESAVNPTTGKKRGQLKTAFKGEYVNSNAEVDLDMAGPIVRGAAVVGYKGWLAGYQTAFDTAKSKLATNNFIVGYDGGDYVFNCNVNDGSEFGGSIHHKVTKSLETGVAIGWSEKANGTQLNFGAKYDLSPDTVLRGKVSNSSQLGLSIQQKLKDGISLTLSALIDGQKFSAGGHRVGLSLEFEQ